MAQSLSITLTLLSVGTLPEQASKRGRPRKSGRAHVDLYELTDAERGSDVSSPEYRALAKTIAQTLSEDFGGTEVVLYAHESTMERMSFIIKGSDANALRTYFACVCSSEPSASVPSGIVTTEG